MLCTTVPSDFVCLFVFLFVCFLDKVVASTFLQTASLVLSFPEYTELGIQLTRKRLLTDAVHMPDLTLHSVTCQRCLVIRVLTNVGVFGVYRKVILSSVDR